MMLVSVRVLVCRPSPTSPVADVRITLQMTAGLSECSPRCSAWGTPTSLLLEMSPPSSPHVQRLASLRCALAMLAVEGLCCLAAAQMLL